MRISDWSSDVCSSDLHVVDRTAKPKDNRCSRRRSCSGHQRNGARREERVISILICTYRVRLVNSSKLAASVHVNRCILLLIKRPRLPIYKPCAQTKKTRNVKSMPAWVLVVWLREKNIKRGCGTGWSARQLRLKW